LKTLIRLLPLAAFLLMVLVLRLSGCQMHPLPSSNQTSASGTTIKSSIPETEKTTTRSLSTTSAATAATTAAPSGLSNKKLGWYYSAPSPLGADKPATIPADVRQVIAPYEVIWQYPQPGRKVVYLTMDEGYEFEANTAQILNIAKMKGISITFFITGSYLEKNPDLVGRMIEEGHLVANHTDGHPNLVDLLASEGSDALLAELDGLAGKFRTLTGMDLPKYVRPPEGSYSEKVLAILDAAGYKTVFWSFAYRDWLTAEQPDPDAAREKILSQIHDGSVLLLHAVSRTNITLLPDLIDEIQTRGYEFATIDEIP
jgi:peptidoglycan-N-acetylmuramic acid deacetylase